MRFLFAETKFLRQGGVALGMLLLQIFQMSLAVGHQTQEAATRVIVLGVLFQMPGQLFNTSRKDGNLRFSRTRIRIMDPSFFDYACLFGLRNHDHTIAYPKGFCKWYKEARGRAGQFDGITSKATSLPLYRRWSDYLC